MSRLCATATHAVDHLRRGLYRLTVYGRCPNPNGLHLVEWVHGSKRAAFQRLDALLALPPSFRASGQPLPARAPATVRESPATYQPGPSGAAPSRLGSAALFPLGHLVATPAALDIAHEFGLDVLALVKRHAAGDWGALDAHDLRANAEALDCGARLLSAYDTPGGRLWIITEADRSATTVLLPNDY